MLMNIPIFNYHVFGLLTQKLNLLKLFCKSSPSAHTQPKIVKFVSFSSKTRANVQPLKKWLLSQIHQCAGEKDLPKMKLFLQSNFGTVFL
jgi:hypothetical protein